eukprot:SAG25_NODE_4227_length_859_cov_1.353947_1_plen_221_part_10
MQNMNFPTIQQIERGGTIVVQKMWEPLQHAPDVSVFGNGSFNFFSPCRNEQGVFTSSISSEPHWQCNQSLTTNAKIGLHGTSITVSGGYQVLCASIPLVHSGKLGGLTLQKQFGTAFLHNANRTLDYLIVGTFNEVTMHCLIVWLLDMQYTNTHCDTGRNCSILLGLGPTASSQRCPGAARSTPATGRGFVPWAWRRTRSWRGYRVAHRTTCGWIYTVRSD